MNIRSLLMSLPDEALFWQHDLTAACQQVVTLEIHSMSQGQDQLRQMDVTSLEDKFISCHPQTGGNLIRPRLQHFSHPQTNMKWKVENCSPLCEHYSFPY